MAMDSVAGKNHFNGWQNIGGVRLCAEMIAKKMRRLPLMFYADGNMEMFDKAIAASLHRTAVYKIIINQINQKAKSEMCSLVEDALDSIKASYFAFYIAIKREKYLALCSYGSSLKETRKYCIVEMKHLQKNFFFLIR